MDDRSLGAAIPLHTKRRNRFHKDYYGLTDVESRILEFIALGKFRAALDGKIIRLGC